MKVAVISSQIWPIHEPRGLANYGGLEVIAWECAKGLAKLGHEVLLMAPDGSSCDGVEVVHCGPGGVIGEEHAYGGFPDLKNQQGKVIRPKHEGYWKRLPECQVVIDHSWQKHSYMLKAEGALPNTQVLGVLHAPCDTMYKTLPPVEKPCMVCISDNQAKHFEQLFHRPSRVCKNGLDLSFYQPLDVPRSNRYLFLARFSKIKGALLAIEACKEAGVGLDLIGDTSITNEPEYLRQCLSLVDGKQIRFIGPCSRVESVYWFSQAHALLHPVRDFREPLGLAPLEAQAAGCPCISWRNGAMGETIDNGKSGFLVDSMEELVGHIKNNSAAQLDRGYCRQWVSDHFSVERMCLRYEELCKEAQATGGW